MAPETVPVSTSDTPQTTSQSENAAVTYGKLCEASYVVANVLASTLMPFESVTRIGECITKVGCIIDQERVEMFRNLPFHNSRTIVRRIKDLSDDVVQELRKEFPTSTEFSIALGESGDIGDTTQLVIYSKGWMEI